MSFEQLFEESVKNFQSQNYQQAAELMGQALSLNPRHPEALTNMALTQYELGQKMAAYVYFKKALSVEPKSLAAQQGLDFVKSQIQVRDIPHQIELYERARHILVMPVPVHIPYFFTWLLLIFVGVRWIQNRVAKRKAFLAGEDRPSFGVLNWILCFLLTLAAGWTLFYTYDKSITRALIREETLNLRSAPSTESPAILEIYGGLEVEVLRREEGWTQIQHPGSYAGWVPSSSLLEL
ncbi:MAG: SH3 domain-containing protein [Bdellovibrionales bacterium]